MEEDICTHRDELAAVCGASRSTHRPTECVLGHAMLVQPHRSKSVVVKLELTEWQRQMVLLALAHLSVDHPGWDRLLNKIARRIDNDVDGRAKLYDEYRALWILKKR